MCTSCFAWSQKRNTHNKTQTPEVAGKINSTEDGTVRMRKRCCTFNLVQSLFVRTQPWHWGKKKKKKKEQDGLGGWWFGGLRTWHWHCCGSGCCCGAGSIPNPGTAGTPWAQPKQTWGIKGEKYSGNNILQTREPQGALLAFSVCTSWEPGNLGLLEEASPSVELVISQLRRPEAEQNLPGFFNATIQRLSLSLRGRPLHTEIFSRPELFKCSEGGFAVVVIERVWGDEAGRD